MPDTDWMQLRIPTVANRVAYGIARFRRGKRFHMESIRAGKEFELLRWFLVCLHKGLR